MTTAEEGPLIQQVFSRLHPYTHKIQVIDDLQHRNRFLMVMCELDPKATDPSWKVQASLGRILFWHFAMVRKPSPKTLDLANGYFYNVTTTQRLVNMDFNMAISSYTDEQLLKAVTYFVQHQHIHKLQQVLRERPQLCSQRVTGSREDTIIHLAVLDDHVDAINVILATDPHVLESTNTQGDTPLQLACRVFSVKSANLLLEWGANIEAEDAEGATPICMACTCVSDRCVEKWQFVALLKTLRRFEADEFKTVCIDGVDMSVLRLLARANRHNLIRSALQIFPGLWNVINIRGADDGSVVEDCTRSESTLRYLIEHGADSDLVHQLHEDTECPRVRKRARIALASADADSDDE